MSDTTTTDPVDVEEASRQARLFAAAPELLDVLEQLLPILRSQSTPKLGDWDWPAVADLVEAVIRKAKGE